MKTAGLREFKAHLSKLVRAAARGERLIVTFRGRPLVEVGPTKSGHDDPLLASGFLPAKRPRDRKWADRANYDLVGNDLLQPARIQSLLDQDRGA